MHGRQFRIEDLDGDLVLVETTSDWSEPRFIDTYWPTNLRTRDLITHEDDRSKWSEILKTARLTNLYGYRYRVDVPWSMGYVNLDYSREIWIPDGGKAKSIKVEFRPYPPPKTRVPVKYEDGKWWKNLKSGWKWA